MLYFVTKCSVKVTRYHFCWHFLNCHFYVTCLVVICLIIFTPFITFSSTLILSLKFTVYFLKINHLYFESTLSVHRSKGSQEGTSQDSELSMFFITQKLYRSTSSRYHGQEEEHEKTAMENGDPPHSRMSLMTAKSDFGQNSAPAPGFVVSGTIHEGRNFPLLCQ